MDLKCYDKSISESRLELSIIEKKVISKMWEKAENFIFCFLLFRFRILGMAEKDKKKN